jgi:anti-anti-sigma factor
MGITVEASRTALAVCLHIAGKIDGNSAPEFERVCVGWISPSDTNMILDFGMLEYISSAGLSAVIFAGKALDRQDGRLLLCGLSSRIEEIFRLSGLDTLFPIFRTQEEALSDCRANARK